MHLLDGSINGKFAYGFIVDTSDYKGPNVMSLQEAEARTILTAVKRAKDKSIFHIIVASYAHDVV